MRSFKAAVLVALGWAGIVTAQSSTAYCDSVSGICFQGYTDPDLDITVGVVLPVATTPPSDELVVQIIAPASYGWSGVSLGGQMADSLLFTIWPYESEVILSSRWTDGYVQPLVYSGPTLTLLEGSGVNSTYITATFRCQNCTVWEDGSLGSGNLSGEQVLAYVTSTETPVDDPSNAASNFTEHNDFSFFGCNLASAQSPSYTSYVNGATGPANPTKPPTTVPTQPPTTVPTQPTTTLPHPTTPTTPAPQPTQTVYGQCGGNGYTGPTICASGSTCTAVSPPYYSQCLP